VFRSIVVPTDGSPFAEQALPLAEEIARRAHGQLTLALVHQPVLVPIPGGLGVAADERRDRELRAGELRHLRSASQRLRSAGIDCLEPVLLNGPVAESLKEAFARQGADLIVMSTHGRGGVTRWWLGSVADRLLRSVAIPLLLVRPSADEPTGTPAAIEQILVPLDGSELAETALQPAAEMALLFEAEVHLLRVVTPVPHLDPALETPILYSPDTEAELYREATDYLAGVATKLRCRGLRVETAVAAYSPVARAVLERAKGNDGMMIALTTHGRSGAGRILLGSVADKVVRGVSCPVLVCPPPVAGLPVARDVGESR
jgi:nucleotide-binding universal stress UspA family protein